MTQPELWIEFDRLLNEENFTSRALKTQRVKDFVSFIRTYYT